MGCTSSSARRSSSRLDNLEEATPCSPSLSSPHSEAPVILESPTSSTGYREMSSKTSTLRSVQPPRRRLHRRRRREPHLDHHISDRLDLLARYLQRTSKFDKQAALYLQTQQAIDDLLDNIHSFFIIYEAEKRPLWRLAQTGRVVQQVESFHRKLDAITARCGLAVVAPSGAGPSLPRWQSRWRRMRSERLVFFRSYLEEQEVVAVSNSRVREYADQIELLTLLKHDAQKFDTLLTADESELLERTFAFVVSCCGTNTSVDAQLSLMSVPEWFVAPYERTKQQFKWQRAAVTVQKAPRGMTSHECLELATRLEVMGASRIARHLPTLASLILRFRDMLQRHVNENPLQRLAATRQVIETNLKLHGELDVLMDRLRIKRSGASIHSWTSQQASHREQLWKCVRLSLAKDSQTLSSELDGEQELALLGALLAFEVKKRNASSPPAT
ncbi:hypothetical protein PF011_g22444 [Phytophthora fragariae]|uniref:Uncharacterized protein n=1 Tax=Phytophthora fragariae TaxID=53985 RepID=A0A6A3IBX7_9STRA|nr:hypothetical protein PF011_g22444 [Phytophthora fragariae]